MDRKKVKRSVMATVLATTLLTSNNVGYANNSLQNLVDQARKDMKDASYAYVVPSQNGKIAPSSSLYPLLNTAKANYQKAKSAIMKSNEKNKDTLLKDLDDLYNERITKGIIPYIDAYNYADKYLNPIMDDMKKAEEAKDWAKVETLYHKLSVQLKTRTAILYRFSGKEARDLLLNQYKEPANLKRDQLIVPVTIYMKVKEAEILLAAGKKEEAIKVLESIKSLISQLPSTSSLPMIKELLEKANDVAKTAGIDLTTPTTPPSTGGGNSGGNNGGGNTGSKNFNLSIMHVNDIHANTDKAPRLVTAVKEVRTVKPDALLLNAGDVFSGTLYFNEFLGQADLKFMNLMKVDAMTFGNHEFDLGSSKEGHQALVDFIKAAKFPFVSANVDFSEDDKFTGLFNTKIPKTPEKPKNGNIYTGIVKEINGERVGIFGLTTAETADISSPGKITFSNYIEDAKRMVAEFEAMGINKIVALTHIGFDDNAAVDNDQELAAKVPGIDVIVGGHSHTQLDVPVVVDKDDKGNAKNKTIIVQAYQYSDYLGTLDVEFDKNGVVVGHSGKLIKTADKAEDAEAVDLLKPYADKIKELKDLPTGATAVKALENPRSNANSTESVRSNETALGNLITDGMLNKAKEYNKDVIMAFQNGGGIRAGIDQGPITVGEVITVLPFGNTLATMQLTGAELKATFETSFKESPKENGGFLHVSGGKIQYDSSKPVGKRVVSIAYKNADGTFTEIQDAQTYTIATNAFTAKGGDGFDVLKKAYEAGRVTDLGLSDWENLRDHVASLITVDPKVEGRIVDVAGSTGSKNFNLSIMHVNDIHANTDKAPKLVTAVKEVRTVKPDALLLNAGDVFSGTLYFNEFLGQADLAFMNLMKVDAMTFGNHEFDLGSSPEGHQALVDFIKAAKFPFVSANVDFSKDDKFTGLFNTKIPSTLKNGNIYTGIVKEINGEKVGIFGLTTAETADISSPGKITFSNYIEDAKRMVAEFEAMGINKIVALTHIGFDDNAAVDNDLELAAKVPGIDVIVGGHSHTQLDVPVVIDKDDKGKAKEKTIIVQAYQYSDYLGTLDVEFDKNGVVVGHAGKLIKTADKAEDEEAVALLKPYKDRIAAVNDEEIGVTLENALLSPRVTDVGYVPGTSVRASETILGNLITDGMLAKAKAYVKDKKVIMAFQNGGGIRAGINAGPITVGEVITVLPFGNTLATMDLTGAEIKATFEISFKDYPKESGGFLHVSGAKVEFDSSKPTGERVVSIAYKNADNTYTEILDAETYTVATNAFTAKGGDGYEVLKKAYEKGRATDLGLSDWENLREHLVSVKNSIPTKIEGRIVDVSKVEEELPGGNIPSVDFSGTPQAPKVYNGDVTVSVTDISLLENAVIKGNLTLIGTLSNNFSLSNITVKGNLNLSGLNGVIFDLNGITVEGELIL
ncbi:5'-nucleotidase C-terminal domain-containing protein [Psychrobacillus sp. NPDC058041]|uniref:5'-nucleotidase C-terminal domain-containing protein n=1 Tax=Psychrobacillus sp. NPDC058041 TaxID=3346310 RepID=UPI0036DB2E72